MVSPYRVRPYIGYLARELLILAVTRRWSSGIVPSWNSYTATIFEKPPLVSFKRDKRLRNSLVKGSLSTELEPGTFKCSRKRCNTCPFITNTVSISGPKNSTQITDHFDCTSRNVIYCIRCTACN